jgi:hypothetical protein
MQAGALQMRITKQLHRRTALLLCNTCYNSMALMAACAWLVADSL